MDTLQAVGLFIASRRSRGLSPHTIRWYQGILVRFEKRFPVLPDSPENIELFLSECQAGDERRHGYYRTLKCFYRFLHRRENLDNPVEKVEAPKRSRKLPHWLTHNDLYKLLSYPHPPEIRAALIFLIDTGARIGELHNLNANNIRETPWGCLAILNGKTGVRIVPMCHETRKALQSTLPFAYSQHRLRVKIAQAFKKAGVKGSAISLRHTFGTLWEGDELVLQQIMGHANLSTTKLYRHLRTHIIASQHHQYSPLQRVLYSTLEMSMV